MSIFKINAAGKQIFLDVFNTPSSTLPATDIPNEILKRFEAAGMPIILEKGITQDAFAKAVLGAYTSLGLSYRNRIKVQPVVPTFSFEMDELPTVEVEEATSLKTYTLDEIKDDLIGEVGTEDRDVYEVNLSAELLEDLIEEDLIEEYKVEEAFQFGSNNLSH